LTHDSIVSDAIIASVIALYLAYTTIAGTRDYKNLAAATNPEQRLRFYRKWGIELVLLTIAGAIALVLTGRSGDLITFPHALAPLHDFISRSIVAVAFWLCVAAFCALMVVSSISVMRLAPNEVNAARARKILAGTPILTRSGRERAWGALMSICAGAGEEIVFRLLFPIALLSLTHSLIAAVLASIVAFGIGHAYQGLGGIFMTAAVGALMFGFYAATQSLWLVAALHALVDLREIVVASWLLNRLARSGTAAAGDPVFNPLS
jgi:membrane protease YdiL (CAAX protease family)